MPVSLASFLSNRSSLGLPLSSSPLRGTGRRAHGRSAAASRQGRGAGRSRGRGGPLPAPRAPAGGRREQRLPGWAPGRSAATSRQQGNIYRLPAVQAVPSPLILPPPAGERCPGEPPLSRACDPGPAPCPMVSTRRSARTSGNRPLPNRVPSEPASSSPPPSLLRRRSRDASPPQRPSGTSEIGDGRTVVVISVDNTLKQPVEAEKQGRQGKEDVVVEEPDEVDEDVELLEEPPGWLPDGWIMEVRRDDDGSIYRYYTSPASGYTFSSKMDTLHYLFSGMEEHSLESQKCAEDNELHRFHTWLPGGWVIEIRAGGKKMDKMYKFYVHLPTGKRLLSKEEVLCYANKGKVSTTNMELLCDTSSDDNILAQIEFNPDGLPDGWVKEMIFRKCNDGIRKDPYYTDPVNHHVFRTLKSVLSYLETGEISKHAYVPRRSVTDMYSFDKCADLPNSMLKRLKVEGRAKQKTMRGLVLDKELPNDRTSNPSEGGTSTGLTPQCNPEGNQFRTVKAGEKEISSEITKRPRGRPKKILKQTDRSTSDYHKSSHKEANNAEVKEEVDIGDGDEMPKEKSMVTHEVDNSGNLAERSLSMRKGDKLDFLADPDIDKQEKGKLTEAGEKVTCSSIHKFYMRRSSNQTLSSKKG